MAEQLLSARARAAANTLTPLTRFLEESGWLRRAGDRDICDFMIGNPQEMPSQGYVDALAGKVVPQDRQWYAYQMNTAESRRIVADSLRTWRGIDFSAEDIFLTNGATAALQVVLSAIVEPGDEVIFISPPWFMYEGMIIMAGGAPVRVQIDQETHDLDLGAIEKAITRKTRAVIINSPHNPTGKIYSPETLGSLAGLLEAAGERNGRTVYLISDEAYSRIVFEGRTYHSPTEFYPNAFLVYTYGKVLLTPGQRMGFIALPPGMKEKTEMRTLLETLQMLCGWAFPNALLLHAFADLDLISIDIPSLERKRDRVVTALRDRGYETSNPEGTFYVLVRSPIADDAVFVRMLIEYGIFCIPGSFMNLPGYFRLSLTATNDMIERSLPGFAEALRKASS